MNKKTFVIFFFLGLNYSKVAGSAIFELLAKNLDTIFTLVQSTFEIKLNKRLTIVC